MVRIVGDDNLSDDERIAAIREATGAGPSQAAHLLAQSRGAPMGDRFVIGGEGELSLTATTGVAVIRTVSFGGASSAEPTPEHVLIQG